MYVLISNDGTTYRTADNLPVIVPDLDHVEPELREHVLEVSREEVQFLLYNAIQAVYGWRYLPAWLLPN